MATTEQSVFRVETSGFVIEAAAGIAAVVLAIIGFSTVDSRILMSIAGIVLGGALFAQGVAIAAEYTNLLEMSGSEKFSSIELGGGMTVEMVAGAAAVVLGILGLLGFYPGILLSIADITIGVSLILSAGGLERLNTLKVQMAGVSDLGQRIAKGAANGALAVQVLAGGAAIVLGILALTMTGMATILTLVGFLVLGAAMAINGAAFTGRLVSLFKQR